MSASGRTRWGWHQLADPWAQRLVTEAGIRSGDLVLDIGAGTGTITEPLLAAGAHVIAVELHPRRAHELRDRFAGRNVTVVQVDASDLRLPRRPFRVVANPPFAIITAILRRLLGPGSRLLTADVVVPRYVAVQWADRRTTYRIQISGRLPRSAFRPPPPGPTARLRIERAGPYQVS